MFTFIPGTEDYGVLVGIGVICMGLLVISLLVQEKSSKGPIVQIVLCFLGLIIGLILGNGFFASALLGIIPSGILGAFLMFESK